MGEMLSVLLAISTILVVSLAWKVLCWAWLDPKKMEKYLRGQGINGPPYKFLYGDIKEKMKLIIESRSKPMGFSHQVVPRVFPFIHQLVEKYGKITYTWVGPTPRLIIMDPDMIREIFSNNFGNFVKTKSTPHERLLVKGVVSYNGAKSVKHRRIINPAFHLEKLKMMSPAFFTSCSEMINKWQKMVREESCELDVWPDIQNLSADVISRTAFGSSYEEGRRIFQLQTEQVWLFIKASQSLYLPGFRFLPTKLNKRMKEIHRDVRALLRDVINKRENAMKAGVAQKDDLLGLLIESNSNEVKDKGSSKNVGLTIDEVIEECKLFYFAGQETTSALIVWTMILLGMHPEWQEKAREEVLQVFGKRNPDFEGLNHLKIVTMILYEVLRLYPPFVLLMRATDKKIKVGEVTLPAGMQISMPTLLVQHEREIWGEDADEFNPERFSGGVSKATKNQVTFFPFGWGPRICIGQTFALIEAKMCIAMILQLFRFKLSPSYVHAPFTIITLQPQHGAQLVLHKI